MDKYEQIKTTFSQISALKEASSTLSMLSVVLAEATDEKGMLKIVIERNKQVIEIPASILTDYIDILKDSKDIEADDIIAKITIK